MINELSTDRPAERHGRTDRLTDGQSEVQFDFPAVNPTLLFTFFLRLGMLGILRSGNKNKYPKVGAMSGRVCLSLFDSRARLKKQHRQKESIQPTSSAVRGQGCQVQLIFKKKGCSKF